MFLGSKVRLVSRADNLTAIYEPIADCLDNVGSLTSHNPIGLGIGYRGQSVNVEVKQAWGCL
jgi:hypothetical protein